MSRRSYQLEIQNKTSVDWYRRFHEIKSGTWGSYLKEVLESMETINVIIESTNLPFYKLFGMLEYSYIIYGVEIVVSFEFSGYLMEALSLNWNLFYKNKNDENSQIVTKIPPKICNISVFKSKTQQDKFIIKLRESRENFLFLNARKIEIEESIKSLAALNLNATIPYKSISMLPKHFFKNLKNKGWKKRIRKTQKSVIVRIVNLTRYTMLLMNYKEHCPHLYEGEWVELPSDQIPPMCYCEFGSKSSSFLTGTSGVCDYSVSSNSSFMEFIWEFSGFASLRCEATHNTHKFSIQSMIESFDCGCVYFHVIDPSNLPAIKILSAYNIPQKQAAKFSIYEIKESINNSPKDYPNLIKPLETYIIESSQTEDTTLERDLMVWNDQNYLVGAFSSDKKVVQFQLASPRALFWNIGNLRNEYSILDPSGHLFLNWQIGCEIFSWMWGPDEPISLHSTLTGGFNNKEAIMNCELINFQAIPSIKLFEKVLSAQFEFSEDGLVNVLQRWKQRREQIAQSKEFLVKIAFDCMKPLSLGIQRFLTQKLKEKFGEKWSQNVKFQRYRVWSEFYLDLDYLLDMLKKLVNIEELESLNCTREIAIINKASKYWSHQILYAFTYDFVKNFLRSAESILIKFDVTDQILAVNSLRLMLEGDLENQEPIF